MSIFQCQNCGCAENTACSNQGFVEFSAQGNLYDWSYAPDRKGLLLCRACGPTKYASGKLMGDCESWGKYGEWHNRFERRYLPLGSCFTNDDGNLEHKETGLVGNELYRKLAKSEPYPIQQPTME